jgi:hypothetical protein
MSPAFEELVRDSMEWLTADVELPVGLAGRARRRHRRRRLTQLAVVAAGAAGAAAVAAVLVTGPAAGAPGPASRRSGDQTTADIFQRVDSALASRNLVMWDSVSLRNDFDYIDGSRSYDTVTWAYRGDTSTRTFGAGGQLQADDGTAVVNGKLRSVQVDYIRHDWQLLPSGPASTPAKPCTVAGFMAAGNDPTPSWPSLIRQELACGSYRVTGRTVVDGIRTIKITGSATIKIPSDHLRIVNTIFVNPATYLPVQISQYAKSVAHPNEASVPSSTEFQWLPATAANIPQTLVTIPPGYPQVQS